MVNTRSTVRRDREQMDLNKVEVPQNTQPNAETSQSFTKKSEIDAQKAETCRVDITKMAGTSVKSEMQLQPPTVYVTPKNASRNSSSSSISARRKKLELEAAKQKAKIQMELIEKQLEADIAELEDEEEYSPPNDDELITHDVEQWLEKSYQQAERLTPERDLQTGEPRSSAPLHGQASVPEQKGADAGAGDTVHLLAKALKDLAAASVAKEPNGKLLSRLCTPRDLPDFSGEPMEWLQFKEAYDESTDVCKFSSKENLWRLRKCLKGAAKDAVAALLISATSPDKIISTLELRFGNPDLIITKILQDVKKLQPLSNDYHKDIIIFSVKVQNLIEAIKSLKREEYLQGMSVVSVILAKLPALLLSKWSDYSYPLITDGKRSRLLILSDFLHEEALKISTTSNVQFVTQRTEQNNRFRQSEHNNNRLHTVLMQSDHGANNNNCQFCRKSKHSLPECKMFKKALRKVRWDYVKRHGVCYKCLCLRHNRETCTAPACDAEGCGQSHHKLLHYPIQNREDTTNSQPTPVSALSENVNHIGASDRKSVLLKVVPIRIHGPNGIIIDTSVLLDDGSTISLISEALAQRAGLRGRREPMHVSGAWLNNELVLQTTVVNVNLAGMDNKIHSIRARSVNELNLPIQKMSIIPYKQFDNLFDISYKLCSSDLKPELLIGQDNHHLLVPLEIRLGKLNEPCATLTPLGWCVHGSMTTIPTADRHHPSHVLFINDRCDSRDESERLLREMHHEVRRSFALDSIGISGHQRENADEVRAIAHLEKTAKLIDGRWYVGLPWRDANATTPNTYPNSFKRLKGIERKMTRSPDFASKYKERIDHLLDNDYAIKLKDTCTTPKTWYLPHFGVDNPNKSKLRLVFDAADRVDGFCLNDYLLTGPDLLSSLFGIMLRFRENKIAVTGDIKDMFLRIKIHPDDQHAFRFLWRNNNTEPVETYVMSSLIFGANCSPFIAQFIRDKNAQRFESSMPSAVNAIRHSHYMDDYIDSLPDEQTAIQMVKNVSFVHESGGFQIRNWTSNSEAVLNSIPKETLGNVSIRFKIDQNTQGERTLGLIWFPKEDMLGFDVSLKRIPDNIIQGHQRPTKRLMLRVIMSVFDVLGFLSPFTIQGKIMLQDTWRQNIEWDDFIPDNVYSKWCKWIDMLQLISQLRIPRCYTYESPNKKPVFEPAVAQESAPLPPPPPPPAVTSASIGKCYDTECCYDSNASSTSATNSVFPSTTVSEHYNDLQLHVFSDASSKAMSAVAYWRWVTKNGKIFVSFIASKCRVLPVKPISIPRAELLASVLAARLANTIEKEHRLVPVKRQFWCDSTTVVYWIRNNTRKYKVFEANRLGEIDELTRSEEWRYIPTKLNIADLATRDYFDYDSFQNDWFSGPKFLYENEASWPADVTQPDSNEIESGFVMTIQCSSDSRLAIPDASNMSSWRRLLGATTMVFRFINKFKGLTIGVDCDMMLRAEFLQLKQAQADSFSSEIAALKNGKCLQQNSRLLSLTPFLDERGLLRVGGRIDAADVAYETRHPVILDGQHPVARLIARHYHIKFAHGNQETVVNELKQKYWLLRLRPTVKSVVTRCLLCRLRKATPRIPMMGDLPPARLAHHQRPYTFCGLDLFGPMEVTVGRRREKRYGVLFTCLTVRAVHIEIVVSLTTDSLIMAIRRMASRRGWPLKLFSDNGTNLRGADNELRKSIQALDEEKLKAEGMHNGMSFNFIPPVSPHWGGAWERLIRSVKTSLQVILRERAPRDEVLSTLMLEVENIVNSRPLTHVSVEPGSVETLTPNHFLLGSSSNLPVIGVFDDSDLFLRKQWRISQRLADMYWRRWVKEVLPELLPRKKWKGEQKAIQVGDLVLVVDPDSPRNTWRKGIVEQVYPGKDGRIRLVDVKTKTGVWRRSVARVAPISLVDEC